MQSCGRDFELCLRDEADGSGNGGNGTGIELADGRARAAMNLSRL